MSDKPQQDKPQAGPSLGDATLGSGGTIRLFGCEVAGVTVAGGGLGGRLGHLAAPKLAWIYGFVFEGHYYDLARPTIFVVDDAQGADVAESLKVTGVPAEPPEFYGDVRVWLVDRDDLGLRLDIETGSFQRLLLDAELRGERVGETYAGATVRINGATVRMSGATVRLGGGGRSLAGDPRRVD